MPVGQAAHWAQQQGMIDVILHHFAFHVPVAGDLARAFAGGVSGRPADFAGAGAGIDSDARASSGAAPVGGLNGNNSAADVDVAGADVMGAAATGRGAGVKTAAGVATTGAGAGDGTGAACGAGSLTTGARTVVSPVNGFLYSL